MTEDSCVPGTKVMYVPRTREAVILRGVSRENRQCLVRFVDHEEGKNGTIETASVFPCVLIKIDDDQNPTS